MRTIDDTIKQSRLEAELLSKGYTLTDIYGQPEQFPKFKSFVKRCISSILKGLFFVVLLSSTYIGLMKLNMAVNNGTVNVNDIPVLSMMSEYYHKLYIKGEEFGEKVNNSTFLSNDENSSPANNLMNSMLDDATSQFDGFLDMADDAIFDMN